MIVGYRSKIYYTPSRPTRWLFSSSIVAMIDHLLGHAAIDANILTCDETSLIATKEQHYFSNAHQITQWHNNSNIKSIFKLIQHVSYKYIAS